ncbi:T9SS type A sorting domain-containing protein [Ekhidna sp.]
MKNLMLSGLLIFGLASQLGAQCTTPNYDSGTSSLFEGVDASIINLSDFDVSNNTFAPHCGVTSMDLQLTFQEDKSWCGDYIDAEYRVYVLYKNYDCNNGQYTSINYVGYDSGPIGYNANNGLNTTTINVPNIVEHSAYYVHVEYRLKKIGCNVWKDWEPWYNSRNFIITETVPGNTNAEGELLFPNCVNEYPSFYGNMEVAGFAPNDDIYLNTMNSIGDWYSWEVFEFDLNSWQKIPGTEQLSPIVNQAFGIVHLHQFYSAGFDPGKIYGVSLNVGACWNSEVYFFEINPVSLDVDLLNSSTRDHTVGVATYTVEQLCLGSANNFKVRDTSCEKTWSISLVEVNNSLQPIGPMYTDAGTGDAGSYISLTPLWGGGNLAVLNKIYRLQYSVTAPAQTETIYFEYKYCDPNPVSDPVMKLSPNPASEYISVHVAGVENFEVSIFDMTGELVYHNEHSSSSNKIDISGFFRGNYILRASFEEIVLTERFSKME